LNIQFFHLTVIHKKTNKKAGINVALNFKVTIKQFVMKVINENISLAIHNLIAVLDDAKKGYLNASQKIKDNVLSLLLERYGYQRGRYSNELRTLVNNMGTQCPVDQFTLSLLQRTWMDLKNTFKHGQNDQVIEACIKAEETALQNYCTAIEQVDDHYEVRTILLQQLNGIRTVLHTIKQYTGKTGGRSAM
jgi:uncharacterized protein (TIGR02284 family)